MSKEEALRGKKTRMENLEKIANNQDLYETNKKFGLKKDERIIDVEGYKLDNSTEKIVDEGVNEVRQKQYQKKQQRNQKEIEGKKREGKGEKSQVLSQQQPLKEKELFDDEKMDTRIKKKQLESQARKRSKQQYQQNGRIGTETNNNATRKRVTLQPTPKVKEEEKEIIQRHQRNERVDTEINNSATKEDLSLKYVGQTVLNEQDQVVANAIMKADGSSYKPTTEAMGNTSIMLRQVFGTGLSNYKGKKEFLHKKNKVRVHAGRPLHIPIRVSIPGSVIELSIEKISSEFHFGILAVPDKGMPVNVKKLAPFASVSGKKNFYKDTILVGQSIAPCTLNFKFENMMSTLLEKVIVTYEIRVTSPTKDLLFKTRQLRVKSCLAVIEDDIRSMSSGEKSLGLKQDIKSLESLIGEKSEEVGLLIREEQRWKSLIAKMSNVP